ncbi:MAG: hypothetical protein K2Y22_04060 [Candidatus Obscuribacterales bacterium]|nr:hypothetical protein [Candidatus Obscuribacterales bacterium]
MINQFNSEHILQELITEKGDEHLLVEITTVCKCPRDVERAYYSIDEVFRQIQHKSGTKLYCWSHAPEGAEQEPQLTIVWKCLLQFGLPVDIDAFRSFLTQNELEVKSTKLVTTCEEFDETIDLLDHIDETGWLPGITWG